MKNKQVKKTFHLTVRFVFSVFFITTIASILAVCLGVILYRLGFIDFERHHSLIILLLFFISSTIIGVVMSAVVSKKSFKQINDLFLTVSEVGKGNFDVSIEEIKKPEFMAELSCNLNLMIKELKNLEIMREDFIQTFSHEFKTPIVSIHGFTKRLLTKELSEEQKQEYLTIIFEESARLSRLAENTLYMSKLDSLEHITENKPFLLDEQIRQSVLLFEKDWTKKNIDMVIDVPEMLGFSGDEAMLKQVWINLISNAIKFTDNGGEVRISASVHDKCIIVSVSDNGIGMSDEIKNRVFDKFYQSDSSRATEGNGLGLSIVKKIIDLSYGTITVKNETNHGTTFTVALPIRG